MTKATTIHRSASPTADGLFTVCFVHRVAWITVWLGLPCGLDYRAAWITRRLVGFVNLRQKP